MFTLLLNCSVKNKTKITDPSTIQAKMHMFLDGASPTPTIIMDRFEILLELLWLPKLGKVNFVSVEILKR
jgi:hypothetical protein